tara:strand:+ start:8022 stop:8666 length:645 start_codon:yes stop_codon:yes gene_type:complete
MNKDSIKILQSPTPKEKIKHRPQKDKFGNTKMLDYVDARFCMDRLDEAVGPLNWRQEFQSINGSMFCGVSILNNGEWITKWDCGTESNFEKEKGLASDAFKRACVAWGIARDLYDDSRKKVHSNVTKKEESSNPPTPSTHTQAKGNSNSEWGETVLEFGKHKGSKISSLPTDYLVYMSKQFDDKPILQEIAQKELAARQAKFLKDRPDSELEFK